MTIGQATAVLERIKTDLSLAENKQDSLEYLVELGRDLRLDTELSAQVESRVPGCASNTYVQLDIDKTKIHLVCFTDSYIVAGYLVIYQQTLNDLPFSDFMTVMKQIREFSQQTKLNLSHIPSRMDAFNRIYAFIADQYTSATFE